MHGVSPSTLGALKVCVTYYITMHTVVSLHRQFVYRMLVRELPWYRMHEMVQYIRMCDGGVASPCHGLCDSPSWTS